ncbi:hypothetical protein QL898_13815, partial [Psychrobacter sp. APC 3279]|uniref:hypothetical protein n=1 Tax=Psychrobacter sp. APC 3279 TaxID=3035189 RepID=UPI0025B4EA61
YLFNSFSFECCTIGSDFLSHDKLLIESLVYQVWFYSFFSIAQNTARDFIKIAYNLSDIDILSIIPKHRHMGHNSKERDSSLEDFKNFLQTCITYFNEFSYAILNKIYPIPITLAKSSSNDYYWDSTRKYGIKKLPNCFYNSGEPLPFNEVKNALSNYYNCEHTRACLQLDKP